MADYKTYRQKPRSELKGLTLSELKERLKEVYAVRAQINEKMRPLNRKWMATQREIDFIKDFIRETSGAAMSANLDPYSLKAA